MTSGQGLVKGQLMHVFQAAKTATFEVDEAAASFELSGPVAARNMRKYVISSGKKQVSLEPSIPKVCIDIRELLCNLFGNTTYVAKPKMSLQYR